MSWCSQERMRESSTVRTTAAAALLPLFLLFICSQSASDQFFQILRACFSVGCCHVRLYLIMRSSLSQTSLKRSARQKQAGFEKITLQSRLRRCFETSPTVCSGRAIATCFPSGPGASAFPAPHWQEHWQGSPQARQWALLWRGMT